jgi:hypothetical protein
MIAFSLILYVICQPPPTEFRSVPQAVASLHAELAIAPYDRGRQLELQHIRDRLAYPPGTKPLPSNGLHSWVTPWDLFTLNGFFGLLLVIGLATRWTTRRRWAVIAIGVGAIGLVVAAWIAWRMRITDERPLRVLARSATLRQGNSDFYRPRLDYPLPAGAEVRERHLRGNWRQVELANGTVGWLPEASLLP